MQRQQAASGLKSLKRCLRPGKKTKISQEIYKEFIERPCLKFYSICCYMIILGSTYEISLGLFDFISNGKSEVYTSWQIPIGQAIFILLIILLLRLRQKRPRVFTLLIQTMLVIIVCFTTVLVAVSYTHLTLPTIYSV
eukprot:TRINITY_DN22704_c0_g1_i2.p1 TRINITY_DN22704_c0_g1~~TRINITY_DN22704_c0_g1_i2.p1  ORF type:complete len:138 (-),score=2.45 TRINITY_DN22704_c0_g1_i2:18-431(-)